MKKKKNLDACDQSPVLTIEDIAGFIHLLIRNSEQGNSFISMRKTLEASDRVLKILGNRLTRLRPDIQVIESEIQREPLDAYTVIGLCEVARRGEAWFSDHMDEQMRSTQASMRALMQHHWSGNSKEVAAKEFVYGFWENWQKQKAEGRDPYPKGKAQFARDVLEKFEDGAKKPVLKTITDSWCTRWEREN